MLDSHRITGEIEEESGKMRRSGDAIAIDDRAKDDSVKIVLMNRKGICIPWVRLRTLPWQWRSETVSQTPQFKIYRVVVG